MRDTGEQCFQDGFGGGEIVGGRREELSMVDQILYTYLFYTTCLICFQIDPF